MSAISGSLRKIDDAPHLVLTRRLDVSIDEAWRDLTESARLERWIGRWEGDPTSGTVSFFMTSESADAPAEPYTIAECDRPRRFVGDTASGWHLWFELAEQGTGTTLTFGHRLAPTDDIGSIGPGWEYYLDRMVCAQAGLDCSSIVWDHYYPVLQDEYERLVAAD
ncbi:MAG: SRPBCC domain-containing protein [Microbacterium sp.]